MTEDEARNKWCPFIRIVIRGDERFSGGSGHTNRDQDVGRASSTRCIGSGCMAWRQGVYVTDRQRWVSFGELRIRPGDDFPSTGEWVDLPEGERRGYCGLAGAPQ